LLRFRFGFSADPHPDIYLNGNADPDSGGIQPGSQNNSDPDPGQIFPLQKE
jgi:hypothetical protein